MIDMYGEDTVRSMVASKREVIKWNRAELEELKTYGRGSRWKVQCIAVAGQLLRGKPMWLSIKECAQQGNQKGEN